MTDEPRPAAYWTGTVAAVAGVLTALLLGVGLPLDTVDSAPGLVSVLFYAAMATGLTSLVAAPAAALLGARRMAAWGSLGLLAWVGTMTFFVLNAD